MLAWRVQPDGASELSVRAVRMTMAALVVTIVLIVLTLGAAATACLILLDTSGVAVGRWLVIILSGSIGVAASIGLLLTMRARRRRWRIRIDEQCVTVTSENYSWSLPLAELRLVRLRQRTDYARILFVGDNTQVTLLAGLGLAPEPSDIAAIYVPSIPAEAQERLRGAGLSEHRSAKSPDLTEWRRSAESNAT